MYFVYTTFAFIYIISAYNYTYSERTPTMPRTVYIGENLERLRLRAALSQLELAKKAGVTPAAVNRIERNRVEPQMRTVRKLAKALDVEPRVLLEGPSLEQRRSGGSYPKQTAGFRGPRPLMVCVAKKAEEGRR